MNALDRCRYAICGSFPVSRSLLVLSCVIAETAIRVILDCINQGILDVRPIFAYRLVVTLVCRVSMLKGPESRRLTFSDHFLEKEESFE